MTLNVQQEKLEILKGGTVNLVGGFSVQILSLAGVFLATHLVSIESFGIYALGLAVVFFFRPLGQLGLERGVLKYVAEYRFSENPEEVYRALSTALRIGIPVNFTFATVLLLLDPIIAEQIFSKAELNGIISIIAFSLPVLFITDIFLFSLRACRDMKSYYYCYNLRQIIFIIVVLIFFNSPHVKGVKHLAWAYLSSAIFSGLFGGWLFARRFSMKQILRSSFIHPLSRALLRFSLYQVFSSVLNNLLLHFDILLIGYFLPAGGVGVYRIASRIAEMILIFLRAIRGIFAPIISVLFSQGRIKELGQLFSVTTRWICTLTLPLFFIIVLFPDPILSLFGQDYQEGTGVLMVLSAGQIINALAGAVGFMLVMSGFAGMHLVSDVVVLLLNLVMNLLLIPRFGIMGAGIATASSIAVGNLIRLYLVYIKIGVQPYSRAFIKPLLAGMTAMAAALSSYHLLFQGAGYYLRFASGIAVFVSIYLATLYILKMESGDKQVMKSVFVSESAIQG
ncbi:MAG: oligosaccharide flippase family protein [Sedimentisphaerales bacterium]|nr:oligosaccharide flippase family protein [Sedimentisphaerales bacterium]